VAGASEDDPRRFSFHRRLQAAAERGDVAAATTALGDMAAAGLPPGPRAWHVAAVAHLKAGDIDGALAASVRADEGGCPAGAGAAAQRVAAGAGPAAAVRVWPRARLRAAGHGASSCRGGGGGRHKAMGAAAAVPAAPRPPRHVPPLVPPPTTPRRPRPQRVCRCCPRPGARWCTR
jgi:hypothetical protein